MNDASTPGAWLDERAYGTYRTGTRTEYADRVSQRELGKADAFFAHPVKNYGRFGPTTRRVLYLAALALRDAGVEPAPGRRFPGGLLLTDEWGCAEANRDYFADYVDGGRTLARANLFIYTLPTGPLAEAAVHFGLVGPLLYLRPRDGADRASALRATARRWLAEGQAEFVLTFDLAGAGGRCLVLGLDAPAGGA